MEAEATLADLLKDYFLSNEMSARKLWSLAKKAHEAGLSDVGPLAKAGNFGKHQGNLPRDFMGCCLKKSDFPCGVYWAEIPIRDRRLNSVESTLMPVLLPHEIFARVVEVQVTTGMKQYQPDAAGPLASVHENMVSFAQAFQVPFERLVPVGVHGDGVPFKAKMRDSLEQVSWNFCGAVDVQRFLFCALPTSAVAGRATWDALWEVFAWSFRCLLMGQWPGVRHDGSEWLSSDHKRQAQAGTAIPYTACLVQGRGDWAFYSKVFLFPYWSSRRICYMCSAANGGDDDFRDCSLNAKWRETRRGVQDFLAEQAQNGIVPSRIFSVPGFRPACVMVDWLHTLDLGISQDIVGQLFYEVLPLLGGPNRKAQVDLLWQRIRVFYREHSTPSRLENLSLEMIKEAKTPAKLRSKAAQCRYLVPFAAALAEEFGGPTEHRATVKHLLALLRQLYDCLHVEPFPVELGRTTCRKMCLLYSALEQEAFALGDTYSWRCKPKLHMVQELLEYCTASAGNPKYFWTYRDEDWGGWLAQTARRRGGRATPSSVALQVLHRFLAFVKVQRPGSSSSSGLTREDISRGG